MIKEVILNDNLKIVYHDVRYIKPTNEEIYEANIRSSVAKEKMLFSKIECIFVDK